MRERITEDELRTIEASWDKTKVQRVGPDGLSTFVSSADLLVAEVRRLRALIVQAFALATIEAATSIGGDDMRVSTTSIVLMPAPGRPEGALDEILSEAQAIREESSR